VEGNAIPEVAPGRVGVHLSWSGPASWVYAPSGWTIQRRDARPARAGDCERLDAAAIARLRVIREQHLSFGVITVREAEWLTSLDGHGAPGSATPAELFRVDLDADRRVVRVAATAKLCFVTALCEGRVVGVHGPASGPSTHEIRAGRIDAITILALDPTALQVCVDVPSREEAADWASAVTLVSGLQLPFRELIPALSTEAAELAEARSRLLPGEVLDQESFSRLARAIRPVLGAAGPPRPSELALLLREAEPDAPDEARGLDPIRVLLAHPTWRRALGFGYFDDDPALVAGQTYEYRITATFPTEDVVDRNHGFATVPSGTHLPVDYSIGAVRIRIPQPTLVELAPATPSDGLVRVTRRGIALSPQREPFWQHPGLDDWSLVADFADPVTAVVLELAEGHDLVFAAGSATGPFTSTEDVPQGASPRLEFAGPVLQLRLRGKGFLHALRVATAEPGDKRELSVVLPPVTLVDTPLPDAPITAVASNLQVPAPPPVDAMPPAQTPARHSLGFDVQWRPAPAFALTAWPADADEAPPLAATIFEVERRLEPNGAWHPVLDDENWTFGDRDGAVRDPALPPGSDLLAAYPDTAGHPTGATLDLRLIDTFVGDDGAAAAPPPGTMHRYRVRAIDAIGRPSPAWRETDAVRLEKHGPPPVPVGAAETGATAPGDPVGVHARVLVRGAPDLDADEEALLGAGATAIVLRWGWHASEREQDPLATEFRVYTAPPLDVVSGAVRTVTTLSTGFMTSYRLDVDLDRFVRADLTAGLRLDAGHPFLIRSHTAGTTVQMIVETRMRTAAGDPPVPVIGPVRLALPLTPDRTRPPAWAERVAIVPITSSSSYEFVLRDRLVVDQDRTRDQLWVGVSAADDQAYVADQLAPAETRPGNESAVVPFLATARFHGRPDLEVPPPLAAVPVIRSPEPGSEPLRFTLDLAPHLPAEALAADRVRHERLSARGLIGACEATADGRVIGKAVEPLAVDDVDVVIPIPNPGDRAALVAALRTGRATLVEDRFLVYLAGHHPYRDRLFAPAHDEFVSPGAFAADLPPTADRWLYRVRAVDRAGHVSAGSATARVVVRVPSLMPGAAPVRLPRRDGDAAELLRIAVAPDPALTHVLLFHAPSVGVGAVASAEVLRVPNRPDLLPAGGFWLGAPGDILLTPTAFDLGDAGVTTDADGTRQLELTVAVPPDGRTRVWLATVTVDGIPSSVAGPYTVHGADTIARAGGG
jgi:hypothetical protein